MKLIITVLQVPIPPLPLKGILLFFFILGCFPLDIQAQDFHYSQFYFSPININPALIGAYEGDFRVVNNYRSQWGSVAGNAYKSLTISIDGKILKTGRRDKDFLGASLGFNNDITGNPRLIQNLYNAGLNYSKSFSERTTNNISIGFQVGYGARSVELTDFSWDNQYANGYDPSLPSGENSLGGLKKSYSDFSAGMLWHYAEKKIIDLNLGAALFHINKPLIGFIGDDKLYSKYVVHTNASIHLQKDGPLYLEPAVELALQGPTTLLVIGTSVKYLVQSMSRYTGYYEEIFLSLGGWYRLGDAFILSSKIDYGPASLGISYDINTSSLSSATSGRGGIEVLLMYSFARRKGK